MATPMTADQFVAALKAEGVQLIEPAGWRTHNREGHGAWGPVNGVLIHHTGGTPPSDGEIVWAGRSDLPGPCAQSYLAKSGVATMTANGRANHAGGGDPNVLQAVIDERYTDRPPAPHKHEGSDGAADGNAHFYGLECSNRGDGKDPWVAVQYDAAVRWAAAICRFHKWSAKSVIGHKEWSDWKPDPTFDMPTFRADVAARLAHPASWNPTDNPPEENMPLTPADVNLIWAHPMVSPVSGGTFSAETFVRYGDANFAAVNKAIAATQAAVTALATALGNQHADVDTATLVAAVQQAIKDAVISVDVSVHDQTA